MRYIHALTTPEVRPDITHMLLSAWKLEVKRDEAFIPVAGKFTLWLSRVYKDGGGVWHEVASAQDAWNESSPLEIDVEAAAFDTLWTLSMGGGVDSMADMHLWLYQKLEALGHIPPGTQVAF